MVEINSEESNRELARKILTDNMIAISPNLHKFWVTNQHKLKQAVIGKQTRNSPNIGQLIKEQT